MPIVRDQEMKIFPLVLSRPQREMLDVLSTQSGLSRCEVLRKLILRETALVELGRKPLAMPPRLE